mgnify:CR=1 FL=1
MYINRLQLKALLLDTIMHIKHKQHLAPNYTNVKNVVCDSLGISRRTTSKKMLDAIGGIYHSNGLGQEFESTLVKFDL